MIDRKVISIRFWLIVGFISAVMGSSLFNNLWHGSFYHLMAFSFVAYTRVIFISAMHPQALKNSFRGYWMLLSVLIHASTVNALLDELFFNPMMIGINEYIAFMLMMLIILYQRKKWTR